MKTKWIVLIVATIIVMVCVATVSAQEGVSVSCDASLDLRIVPICVRGEGYGGGTLYVTNTGAQGTSQLTLEAELTRGTGVITPTTTTLTLGPGETVAVHFVFKINETISQLSDGAQIKWQVIDETCRPEHNIGKHDKVDFPWCEPPNSIVLASISTHYLAPPQALKIPLSRITLFVIGGMVILIIWIIIKARRT